MILYRIESKLFLSAKVDDRREITQVYDDNDNEMIPSRFYIKSAVVFKKYYDNSNDNSNDDGGKTIFLVVLLPGVIMINVGCYNKVKEGIWLPFYTEKDDVPIDFMVKLDGFSKSLLVIKFLYSDLSFSVIIFEEGIPKLYSSDKASNTSKIVAPIRSLNIRNSWDDAPIVVDSENVIHSIAMTRCDDGYNLRLLSVSNNKRNHEAKIIGGGNGCIFLLYSDGLLISKEFELEDVIKTSDNIALRSNNLLVKFDRKSGEETFVADGVTNFFYDIAGYEVYMIKNDQLIHKSFPYLFDQEEDDEIVLDKDASEIRFPTTSHYDVMLNSSRSSIKSAMIRHTSD